MAVLAEEQDRHRQSRIMTSQLQTKGSQRADPSPRLGSGTIASDRGGAKHVRDRGEGGRNFKSPCSWGD